MLINYRFTEDGTFKLGLAVKQWSIDNEPRIYVLLPQHKYCEVDVVYPTEYEWGIINNFDEDMDFSSKVLDKDKLPDVDKETDENLYFVWDDGASKHPERAAKLYEHFNDLIDQNKELALSSKEKYFKETYQIELVEAQKKGFDLNLVKKQEPQQPYDSY